MFRKYLEVGMLAGVLLTNGCDGYGENGCEERGEDGLTYKERTLKDQKELEDHRRLLAQITMLEDTIFSARFSVNESTQAVFKQIDQDRKICIASAIALQLDNEHVHDYKMPEVFNLCNGISEATTECMLNIRSSSRDNNNLLYKIVDCNKTAVGRLPQ